MASGSDASSYCVAAVTIAAWTTALSVTSPIILPIWKHKFATLPAVSSPFAYGRCCFCRSWKHNFAESEEVKHKFAASTKKLNRQFERKIRPIAPKFFSVLQDFVATPLSFTDRTPTGRAPEICGPRGVCGKLMLLIWQSYG